MLFASFASVALLTQHLAVLDDRPAARSPRCDVVAFHEFEVELLMTNGADVLLLFPYSQFNVFREGP